MMKKALIFMLFSLLIYFCKSSAETTNMVYALPTIYITTLSGALPSSEQISGKRFIQTRQANKDAQ